MLLIVRECSCSLTDNDEGVAVSALLYFSHGAGSCLEPKGAHICNPWPWMIKGYLHGSMFRAVAYIPFAYSYVDR